MDRLGKSQISEDRVCSGATLEPYLHPSRWPVLCAQSESEATETGRCGQGHAAQIRALLHVLGHEEGRWHEPCLMLRGYEANGYENNGMCYPLADWTQKDILSYMRQNGLPEPVRYSLKASSGVGFNLDCMLWLEKNYPQDLQRIYKVFPMAERILWEHKQKQ